MLQALEKETKRSKTYLNINKGRIVRRTPNGEEYYKGVEGGLQAIYQKERIFKGGTAKYWYIDLLDESGEVFSIGFSFGSNIFKSIVLSLASITSLDKNASVYIEPYLKNNLEKVVVYYDGVKLDWVTRELPPIESVAVGGNVVKDDSKRMAFITSLVDKIGKQII